jgi:hypothetical protein
MKVETNFSVFLVNYVSLIESGNLFLWRQDRKCKLCNSEISDEFHYIICHANFKRTSQKPTYHKYFTRVQILSNFTSYFHLEYEFVIFIEICHINEVINLASIFTCQSYTVIFDNVYTRIERTEFVNIYIKCFHSLIYGAAMQSACFLCICLFKIVKAMT